MLVMAVRRDIFFKNIERSFNVSLFWRRKSGKAMVRDCWRDEKIWDKVFRTKNEEIYRK